MLYHSRPRFDCETVIWWMRCDVRWCEVIQVILFVFHCHWCGVAGPSETEGVVHCSVSSSKTELRLDSAGSISSVLHLHQHYHLTSLHALFSLSDISHWIGFNPILSGSLSVGLPLLLLRMILFIPGGWEDVKLCPGSSSAQLSIQLHITYPPPSSSLTIQLHITYPPPPSSLYNYTYIPFFSSLPHYTITHYIPSPSSSLTYPPPHPPYPPPPSSSLPTNYNNIQLMQCIFCFLQPPTSPFLLTLSAKSIPFLRTCK